MISTNLKLLNIQEELEKNYHTYVDYFVKYYGEDKREWIEEQLSRVLLIGFVQPIDKNRFLQEIKKEKSREIFQKYLTLLKAKEDVDFYYKYDSFSYYLDSTFTKYYDFLQAFLSGKDGRREKYIENALKHLREYNDEITRSELLEMMDKNEILDKYKNEKPWTIDTLKYYINPDNIEKKYQRLFEGAKEIIDKIDPSITKENFREHLDDPRIKELNLVAVAYPKMYEDYIEFARTLKPFDDDLKEMSNLESEMNDKYLREFILNNLKWIPEDRRSFIKDFISKGNKNSSLDSYLFSIYGTIINGTCPLDFFSKESNEKLNNPNTPEWEKELIQNKRKQYWDEIGEVINPTEEEIVKLQESRKYFTNQKNIDIFESLSSSKKIRKKIIDLQLLDKNDSFDAELLYTKYATAICPNIRRTDDGYELYTLLTVNANSPGLTDHNVIHELNHILELSLKSANDEGFTYYSGWEYFKTPLTMTKTKNINTLEDDDSVRGYELFNEIINELITQDIYNLMIQDEVSVIDTKENRETKSLSNYDRMIFIARDFFQEFKDKILESRKNGQIEIIWDEVGKENFDALNELFHEFYNHFLNHNIRKVLKDISQGIETEDTIFYKELKNKRDEILKKMRTYKMMHEEKKEEPHENYYY